MRPLSQSFLVLAIAIAISALFVAHLPSGTAAEPYPIPGITTYRLVAPIAYGPFPTPTSTPLPTATAVPIATPNPLTYECKDLEYMPWRSYFYNTQFEGGFDGDAPFGWTGFRTANASYGEETVGEKFDDASFKIGGSGAFRAGIYQTVKTVPGRWYHTWYATAQVVFGGPGGGRDGSLPILREVGADLNGGTDPDSAAVVWGRPIGGQPDKDAKRYGGWKTLGDGTAPLLSFRATSKRTTVFLRASGWPDVTASTTWMDSAYVTDACQGGYRPIGLPPTPAK